MAALAPCAVCDEKVQPFFGAFPERAELLYYAAAAFEIPTMPVLSADYQPQRSEVVTALLYRFRLYLTELHAIGECRAVALQLMCHPESSDFNARVRAYVICRAAALSAELAKADAQVFALQAFQRFPSEGMFSYGSPAWLSETETRQVLFADPAADSPIDIAELRKFEDFQPSFPRPQIQYVAHRFWPDAQRDPWPALIETLSTLPRRTAIRIELTPVTLHGSGDEEFLSNAGRWFGLIAEDLERKATQGEQVRTDGVVTEEMLRANDLQIASDSAANVAFVKRGRHVFAQWLSSGDHLFSCRVLLAAFGTLPQSIIGAVRAALGEAPATGDAATVGWVRPQLIVPAADERRDALACLRQLAELRWGEGESPIHPSLRRFRALVTPEEAVSLFHLPIYDRAGQTSAVSTAEYPFVIPPEVLKKERFGETEQTVSLGNLYQRERLLDSTDSTQSALPFAVTVGDLMKPSLLVGAPGSGKTNLAFSLMVQMWRKYRIPFLVLDPSTGQEFRLLLREPSLRQHLVYYTVGEDDVSPLRFNPFSVPPDMTARNHLTRILAAFKAAFQFYDPVPAIYEGALERVYTQARYNSGNRTLPLAAKADLSSPAPTFNAFAAAIQDEVQEKAQILYEGAKESIGVIRGASTIRVNAIGRKLGFIMNVDANTGGFMQKLLQRPVVIELGALGDSSNIALVMAFLLAQIAGHIEHAHRQNPKRRHVMFVEEAHRLLAAGSEQGAGNKSAEDINVMLAEMRKFGQGILVMDQRPSSLVGGVLDNAYVKILTRLSDRVGFDRLSDELNLNDAQRRYARTRLRAGEAIALDRESGQPVLVRSENIKDEIQRQPLSAEDELTQNRANIKQADMEPPPPLDYVEPVWDAAAAGKKPTDIPKEWLTRRVSSALEALLLQLGKDADLYHGIKKILLEPSKSVVDAKGAADTLSERHRAAHRQAMDRIWEQLKWALISSVAQNVSLPETQKRALAFGDKPPLVPGTVRRTQRLMKALEPLSDKLTREFATLMVRARDRGSLWWEVRVGLLENPASRVTVLAETSKQMASEHKQYQALASSTWQQAIGILVEHIAADAVTPATAQSVRERADKKREAQGAQ